MKQPIHEMHEFFNPVPRKGRHQRKMYLGTGLMVMAMIFCLTMIVWNIPV